MSNLFEISGRYQAVSLALLFIWLASDLPRAHAQNADDKRFPNVTLTTQDGKQVKVEDLVKDRVVVVNTMFTRCTGVCEQSTKKLVELKKVVALDPRLKEKVSFFSLTVQPDYDNAERLKAYASMHHAEWTFLTGKPEDVMSLRRSMGLGNLDRNLKTKLFLPNAKELTDAPEKEHSDMILIYDDSNQRWHKASILSSSPEQLVQMISRVVSEQ